MADTYKCPNCGGDVKSQLKGLSSEGEETVVAEPKGKVGVCQDCNMAVPMTKEHTEGPSTDSPPSEANTRGEPGPERYEDSVYPEGPDFVPAPTTSPEVPLEASVPDNAEEVGTTLGDEPEVAPQ